jgi:hypothetical protein
MLLSEQTLQPCARLVVTCTQTIVKKYAHAPKALFGINCNIGRRSISSSPSSASCGNSPSFAADVLALSSTDVDDDAVSE